MSYTFEYTYVNVSVKQFIENALYNFNKDIISIISLFCNPIISVNNRYITGGGILVVCIY